MPRDDTSTTSAISPSGTPAAEQGAFDQRRRTALARLAKAAGYAAPVTIAMLSMKAVAAS
mgnify:CR=1 FL=1